MASHPYEYKWWYIGAFISIVLSFIVYGIALRREWKREIRQRQENCRREQREIAREEREQDRGEHWRVTSPTTEEITPENVDEQNRNEPES